MITSNDQENEKGHINFLECLMCRSTLAMEGTVEIHSQAPTSQTSLPSGLKTGLLSKHILT